MSPQPGQELPPLILTEPAPRSDERSAVPIGELVNSIVDRLKLEHQHNVSNAEAKRENDNGNVDFTH